MNYIYIKFKFYRYMLFNDICFIYNNDNRGLNEYVL